MRRTRWWRGLAAVCGAPLVVVLGVAVLPYLGTTFHQFDAALPFTGPHWFNPYANLPDTLGRWRQANFHAHSVAWGGVTDGHSTPTALLSRYRAMGYDVAALSNYHAPMPAPPGDSTFVSAYEHGWNVRKTHRLVLGAQRVVWRDHAFGGTVHQKQQLLSSLRASGAVVALAHPELRGGHTVSDVRLLADYDLIEVLNHFVTSDTLWDAALTAGRLPWILAGDDSHDAEGHGETGVAWTMLFTSSTHAESTYAALRTGRSYGVRGHGGRADLALVGVTMHGDTLHLLHRGAPAQLQIVGDSGRVIATMPTVGQARVVIPPWAHYARAVLTSETSALWLNPVVRWDGRALPVASAPVDVRRTLAYRTLLLLCALSVAWRLSPAQRRRRVAEPAGDAAVA
jgi:hypothetical protein